VLPPGDTIAAIATATGPAAIGIVRLSGPRAGDVLARVVPAANAARHPRRMCRGRALDPRDGSLLDDVLCFFAPGPATVTGEDVAEIHGHGGPVVLGRLLAAALAAGARAAEPGEFTYRGFVGGRLDLTRAEAVAHLIAARSERAANAALARLDGAAGRALGGALDALTVAAARVEAGLDFPDEDLPPAAAKDIAAAVEAALSPLREAERSFALGARLADGARIALAGPVNAGKSSLLNRLAGAERALVDAAPGTTRDVVEARGEISGVPVLFCDTAGLRPDASGLEGRGIEAGRRAVREADALVIVLDGAAAGSTGAVDLAGLVARESGRPALVACNKSDLPGFSARVPAALADLARVEISARTGAGIDALVEALGRLLIGDDGAAEPLLSTARQHRAVEVAIARAGAAAARLREGADPELAAEDLRRAREALAGLFGADADAQLLDGIFSTFCLGK
jgi:tRNA modification GTPase